MSIRTPSSSEAGPAAMRVMARALIRRAFSQVPRPGGEMPGQLLLDEFGVGRPGPVGCVGLGDGLRSFMVVKASSGLTSNTERRRHDCT